MPNEERKAQFARLLEIFPKDERLCNAVFMGRGSCEQLAAMGSALCKQLDDLPPPGESTVQWEALTQLALADTLRWVTQLELAMHDLRASLFYRYNNRVIALKPPDPVAEAAAIEQIEKEAAPPPPPPPPAKPPVSAEERKLRAAKALGNLFGDPKKG